MAKYLLTAVFLLFSMSCDSSTVVNVHTGVDSLATPLYSIQLDGDSIPVDLQEIYVSVYDKTDGVYIVTQELIWTNTGSEVDDIEYFKSLTVGKDYKVWFYTHDYIDYENIGPVPDQPYHFHDLYDKAIWFGSDEFTFTAGHPVAEVTLDPILSELNFKFTDLTDQPNELKVNDMSATYSWYQQAQFNPRTETLEWDWTEFNGAFSLTQTDSVWSRQVYSLPTDNQSFKVKVEMEFKIDGVWVPKTKKFELNVPDFELYTCYDVEFELTSDLTEGTYQATILFNFEYPDCVKTLKQVIVFGINDYDE